MKEILSTDTIIGMSRLKTFNEFIEFIMDITEEDDIPDGYCDIDASYEQYLKECEKDDWEPMSYHEFAETKLEHYMKDCDARHYIEFLLKRLIIDFAVDEDAIIAEVNKRDGIWAYDNYEYAIIVNTVKGAVALSLRGK